VLSASLCSVVNTDPYTLVVACWATLQLTWVTMLIFTQLVQVSRAMTTYENMYGVQGVSATTAFTSTGTPLDPNHPSLSTGADPHAGHNHKHKGGMLKQWSRLLGVDPFIETVAGRGAATGKSKKKKNPYSRGCMGNCKDFWCDPSPIFGPKQNGTAVFGGDKVDYTMMYESPTLMSLTGGRRARDGYEVVGTEEV
jgi:palmitoyltransferase ZDHHC13/17